MNKRKITMLLVLLGVASLFSGVDPSYGQPQSGNANGKANQNQLNDEENASAALRKSKGLRRYATNDDRKAAAKRNADRKAEHKKAQGGAKI